MSIVPLPLTSKHRLRNLAYNLMKLITNKSSNQAMCLRFESSKQQHVNHGLFWLPDTEYGNFWADFLIKPTEAGYIVSAGYGGAHCLLIGVAGTSAGWTLTGNVRSVEEDGNVSFSTVDTLRHNEWAHIAISYDGTWITLLINGVPCSITAMTGSRLTIAPTDGVLYVGGSDHQNFGGLIAMARIIEGSIPVSNIHQFALRPPLDPRTSFYNATTEEMVVASFLADYRNGTTEDISLGLEGANHTGFLAQGKGVINGDGGYLSLPTLYNRDESQNPTWSNNQFKYTGEASEKTQIANTRIYDDFSGADSHYGNSTAVSLGTTRVGGKTWSADGQWGKINGNAYPTGATSDPAIVTDTEVNGTVILRKQSTNFPAGIGGAYYVIFRYVDANNHNILYIDEYGQGHIFTRTDGNLTDLGLFSFGSSWTEAKVVMNGNTITAFKDGVLVRTENGVTTNNTGTGKGFFTNSPLLKVSEFGVI